MEPQALRAFLAVAETGSFTTAAARVHRTQSAVSMSVRALEDELGRELFHRLPRGVRLTEAGERLRALAGPLLHDWDAVPGRVAESLTGELSGRLVVGAGEAMLLHWLPGVVKRFRKRHPGVAVVLRHQPKAESLAQLATGDIDVAVRSLSSLPARDIEARPLLTSERCVVAPPGTGLPRKLDARRLAAHPFVLPRAGALSRRVLEDLFEREGLPLRIALESGAWALLIAHVSAGLGLAVVPDVALSPGDRRRLEVRRAGALLGAERFGLLLDPRRPQGRAAAAFIDMCAGAAV